MTAETQKRERIAAITMDGGSGLRRSAEAEHERNVALTDLLHENHFSLIGNPGGPYDVTLRIAEGRLVFEVQPQAGAVQKFSLSIQPLKSIIRDYFLVCESYYAALKDPSPHKIEAIDMGRRGIHNEGSEALQALLLEKIEVDFATARRLFTLVCVLHMK